MFDLNGVWFLISCGNLSGEGVFAFFSLFHSSIIGGVFLPQSASSLLLLDSKGGNTPCVSLDISRFKQSDGQTKLHPQKRQDFFQISIKSKNFINFIRLISFILVPAHFFESYRESFSAESRLLRINI